ncbi:helix-turn-helix domain-containing protein [Methanospirillum hungatei]|uniref:ArsR/SmtB family transcription factor n=1 Tax=Methanospirillum hungatei TaxID=2203 RepID=UPI0026E9E871|nr:helix-turn-helix domain-containing protein [Methanospirillum hungatei]MCA1917401.1 helix-turn-helix domain-containing protein [Methanospirillum hungatei]
MSEEPEIDSAQKVRLLSPDDEQARLIGKAIASETAGKILSSMAGREVTAMMLSEELETPVSTVMYHLENLASAGLIEVSRTRYSVKGREMEVYRLIDQVLIVSPKSFDLKPVLARCATLLSIPLALAALLTSFSLFHSHKAAPLYYSAPAGSALKMESNIASYAVDRMMEIPAPTNAPIAVPTQWVEEIITPFPDLPEVAEGILIGAVLVIIVGLIFDFYRKR